MNICLHRQGVVNKIQLTFCVKCKQVLTVVMPDTCMRTILSWANTVFHLKQAKPM